MTTLPIVIVGGGQAGGWAAKTLRDEGYGGPLVLIGDELHPPYERPPLSKSVLAGTAAHESTHLFKSQFFAGLALDWRAGRRAMALDRSAREVRLDDGTTVRYRQLLLCTGGHARVPDLDVPSGDGLHVLRSLDDALALQARLVAGHRLLVVGGGWIGLEVAATARTKGMDVHVAEALDRPCARVLPPAIAARLVALHEAHGVTFSFRARIVRLDRVDGSRLRATFADGTHVDADTVVAGLGLVANDALARTAGLACANGILVDARCATADPAIFAAGDVAVASNRWAAAPLRLESWQNAQDQGIAAARAMLGHDVRYDPVPRFWSDQYDVNVQIVGLPDTGCEIVERTDPSGPRVLVLALRDGRVRAAIGFNAGRDMRAARGWVERAATVDRAKFVDPAVDLRQVEAAG